MAWVMNVMARIRKVMGYEGLVAGPVREEAFLNVVVWTLGFMCLKVLTALTSGASSSQVSTLLECLVSSMLADSSLVPRPSF